MKRLAFLILVLNLFPVFMLSGQRLGVDYMLQFNERSQPEVNRPNSGLRIRLEKTLIRNLTGTVAFQSGMHMQSEFSRIKSLEVIHNSDTLLGSSSISQNRFYVPLLFSYFHPFAGTSAAINLKVFTLIGTNFLVVDTFKPKDGTSIIRNKYWFSDPLNCLDVRIGIRPALTFNKSTNVSLEASFSPFSFDNSPDYNKRKVFTLSLGISRYFIKGLK